MISMTSIHTILPWETPNTHESQTFEQLLTDTTMFKHDILFTLSSQTVGLIKRVIKDWYQYNNHSINWVIFSEILYVTKQFN